MSTLDWHLIVWSASITIPVMMMMVQTTKKANGLLLLWEQLQAIFAYISLKDPNSLTPLCRTKTLIVAIFGPWTQPANLLQNKTPMRKSRKINKDDKIYEVNDLCFCLSVSTLSLTWPLKCGTIVCTSVSTGTGVLKGQKWNFQIYLLIRNMLSTLTLCNSCSSWCRSSYKTSF